MSIFLYKYAAGTSVLFTAELKNINGFKMKGVHPVAMHMSDLMQKHSCGSYVVTFRLH